MQTSFFRPLSILLLLVPAFVQAQFTDSFDDGDFTSNPGWSGDTDKFEIDPQQRLWLNAPSETGAGFLTTESQSINDATWEFLARLEFNPSSANNARVYLVADGSDLASSLNGYYVRIGGETEDRVSLYRQSGSSSSQLITSADGLVDLDPVEIRVQVTRDATGNWEMFVDPTGGTAFQSVGTAFDDEHVQSFFFGVYCEYTSTRSDKFRFDDFSVVGDPFVDNELPELLSVVVQPSDQLLLTFSEPVGEISSQNASNYTADNGLGNPASAVRDAVNWERVELTFNGPFSEGVNYTLSVSGVEDLSGNTIAPTTEPFLFAVPEPAAFRDVVINEFMADETPTQGTPETEYVEVFNTTQDKFIEMTGWSLCDNSSCGTIQDLLLGPGDHTLLVPTSGLALFPISPNVTQVTSWAALNNSGDDISLQDTAGTVVDFLSYTDDWYQDDSKDDGGWSLEQVDPFRNCASEKNWMVSENASGGTPGFPNSVLDLTPDTIGPVLTDITVVQSDQVVLIFDEPLEEASVEQNAIAVDPPLPILAVAATQPDLTGIDVLFTEPLDSGITYTFHVTDIADCEGNPQQLPQSRDLLLPFSPDSGELVINEVLFNPFTGGRDYVELYNRSDRPVNLKNCLLANFADDTISNLRLTTGQNMSVRPGGYVCLTQDSTDVIGKYINHGVGNFVQMASLPSYNNDEGSVLLLGPDSSLFERFDYEEDMHFPLLDDVKGVSLERLDAERDVNDRGNWHSAAQTSGFGTPGLENSQLYATSEAEGEVSTDPEIFSPDSDGHNDVLNVHYSFPDPGYVANVKVYDANGRPVRDLAINELLGAEGTFTWDGTTDKGEKARIGMYIILFEAFSTGGETVTHRLSTVLGGRL